MIPILAPDLLREERGVSTGVLLYILPLNTLLKLQTSTMAKYTSVGYLTITGKSKKVPEGEEDWSSDTEQDEDDSAESTFSIDDLKNGNIKIVVCPPESIHTEEGKKIFSFLFKKNLILATIVDEVQKFIHWRYIRPVMFDIIPFILAKSKSNPFPFALLSATVVPEEVKLASKAWCLKRPLVLKASPVQEQQHLILSFKRPPTANNFRTLGAVAKNGEKKLGLVDILNAVYLDKYVDLLLKGEEPDGSTIIFCHKKIWTGQIDEELSRRLPQLGALPPHLCPWVVLHGGIGDCTTEDVLANRTVPPSLWAASNGRKSVPIISRRRQGFLYKPLLIIA